LDISHHKAPDKIPLKSDVKCEGAPSVGRYGGAVGCEEIVAGAFLGSWDKLLGKDAKVRTSVDQEYQVADSVGYEEVPS
jgi:hypothetical protein